MSIGITQMTSLLSTQGALKSISNQYASRTAVKGQTGIMASEIKQDQARGVDTANKEEALAEKEERPQTIDENMSNSLSDLNEQLASDREKIRKEEAEQERQAQKAEDKAGAAKTEKTGEIGDSNIKTTINPATGIAEPVDVVEISVEARAAAAATGNVSYTPLAPIPATTQEVGKADKKI